MLSPPLYSQMKLCTWRAALSFVSRLHQTRVYYFQHQTRQLIRNPRTAVTILENHSLNGTWSSDERMMSSFSYGPMKQWLRTRD